MCRSSNRRELGLWAQIRDVPPLPTGDAAVIMLDTPPLVLSVEPDAEMRAATVVYGAQATPRAIGSGRCTTEPRGWCWDLGPYWRRRPSDARA